MMWSFAKLTSRKARYSKLGDGVVAARSAGGRTLFNGREVIIDRTGSVSFLMHGMAGTKAIPISRIRAVRLHPARGGARGYLQLKIRGVRRGPSAPAADENSILFDAPDQAAFQRLATAIKIAIRERRMPVVISGPGAAGEIGRLEAPRSALIPSHDEIAVHAQPSRTEEQPTPQPVRGKPLEEAATTAAVAREAFLNRWTDENA